VPSVSEHSCEIIQSIKHKFNLSLREIQENFNGKLSKLVTIDLIYNEKQSREAWQKGTECLINILDKRLNELLAKVELIDRSKKEYVIIENSLKEKVYSLEALYSERLKIIQEQEKRIEGLIAENKYLIDHIEHIKRKQQAKMGCHL
jgi:hypothetical protein